MLRTSHRGVRGPDRRAGFGRVDVATDRAGLGHLPTRDLKFYYTVERKIMETLTIRQCGMAVSNRMRPARFAELTSRVAARLNTEALQEYYRIGQKPPGLGRVVRRSG